MARIPSPWRRSPAPYPSCLTSSANDRSPMPRPTRSARYFCFAMIWFLILSYVAFGTTFFLTRSSLPLYGRPSTIFFAYASPIPGNALSSSADAVLMSTSSFFASDFVSVLVASFFAGASVLVCARAGESPSETVANRTAISTATSLNIGVLLVKQVGNAEVALNQYTSNDFNDLDGVCECIHVLDSRRARQGVPWCCPETRLGWCANQLASKLDIDRPRTSRHCESRGTVSSSGNCRAAISERQLLQMYVTEALTICLVAKRAWNPRSTTWA